MSKVSSGSTSKARTRKLQLRRKGNADTAQTTVGDTALTSNQLDEATRRAMIAEAAYYRAERRGFAPGSELEDWLLSESELDAQAPTQIERESLARSALSSAELH